MPENKNIQYGIIFLVFVVIMMVIAVLNNKIAEEIDNHPADRLPVAPMQDYAVEEVKAVLPDTEPELTGGEVLDAAGSSTGRTLSAPTSVKQEETEVVYELPLKGVELPQ